MKILHLEDNLSDAELCRRVIREEWPQCEINTVTNREGFIRELEMPFDIIVSDFSLLNFDGLEALRLVRAKHPETPFIFLSGTIGEERALDALRTGATDYVLKDRPKRLIPAMKRALKEIEQRKEREQVREQLARIQRLENIGVLAAGIAHDFNNVLTPLLLGLSVLKSKAQEPGEIRILNNMENSAKRGANLVKQIMGFTHGATGERQVVQPRHLLRELTDMMQQTFPKGITLTQNIGPDLWPVKINPTQLYQVLLNLCVNARDAMPQGGSIKLKVENRRVSADPHIPDGSYVQFEIADTGTGIPPAIAERIWDPFFTTKKDAEGTGLGLSIVRGIVEENLGTISLYSQPGKGSEFRILLPAVPGEEIEEKEAKPATVRAEGELVLLVDDDQETRNLLGTILGTHGYHVITAADGAEALALFAPRHLQIKAVITDNDMPFLDGLTLSNVMRRLNPVLPILMITGRMVRPGKRLEGRFRILEKPFTPPKLLEELKAALTPPPLSPDAHLPGKR